MRTTLVTGATGFIGRRFVEELLDRGDRVRALVRDTSRSPGLAERGVELVPGDVTDPASLRPAVRGADCVYHCAALVGDWFTRADIQRVNVDGTQHVLESCAAESVPRLLYLSSLSVLGARHHSGTDESAPYVPTGEAYSDAKIDSERLVRSFAERGDVETVVLRPGFVYGPGEPHFIPRLVDSLQKGRFAYIGDGSKLLNVVHVSDVAQAALLADTRPGTAGEVYNLTDGSRTSLRDWVTFTCEQLAFAPPTRRLPPKLAWALVYLLEGVARAKRSKEPPRLSKGSMRFLYYNQLFSIEKARRELGYSPQITYRQGLPSVLEPYRRPSAQKAPAAPEPT